MTSKKTALSSYLLNKIGDSVLMGAVPMENIDLVISPSRRTITVNPQSPNIPSALVKKNR